MTMNGVTSQRSGVNLCAGTTDTPRQAADDPTRRGDLIKLLDTFPAGEATRGGMDAERLRVALGLR